MARSIPLASIFKVLNKQLVYGLFVCWLGNAWFVLVYVIWLEVKRRYKTTEKKKEDRKKVLQWRATDYTPKKGRALQSFETIKKNSACIFARSAILWCARDWDHNLTLEENALRAVAGLTLVATTKECVDGYIIEICNENKYFATLEQFSHTVRRVLLILSDADPSGANSCRKTYIHRPGWCFEFAAEPFFITTFAPFYGKHSARYSYPPNKALHNRSAFILFQPESSFLRHNLPPDTPHTKWSPSDPSPSVRDLIRRSFRSKGQAYAIPPTTSYSQAEHIVRPLPSYQQQDPALLSDASLYRNNLPRDDSYNDTLPIVKWWLSSSNH